MNIKKLLPHVVTETKFLLGEDCYGPIIGDKVDEAGTDYSTVTVKSLKWLGLELLYHYNINE